MQARRSVLLAEIRILAYEQADIVVVVARAKVVEIRLVVVVMAGVLFGVDGGASGQRIAGCIPFAQVAPGVVDVGLLQSAGGVGQGGGAAQDIVMIELDLPPDGANI